MAKSRFRPIIVPEEVKITVTNSIIKVQGPLGSLERSLHPRVKLELVDNKIFVKNADDTREAAKQQGTAKANITNMIAGVTNGHEKKLIVEGTGYRAQLTKDGIQLFLGYAKPVDILIPSDIKCEVQVTKGADRQDITYISVRGCDKVLVGDFAARIRRTRIPDPYKHKGVKYAGEVLRKKVGKRAAVQA